MFQNSYKGKKVLITGHTGFKGSWLSLWLNELGAELYGYALDPLAQGQNPAFYDQLHLGSKFKKEERADVRDLKKLSSFVKEVQPDYIFHLAAQPLVRLSYEQPVETFETNVMGTINVLEAVRQHCSNCIVLCITTDKCYENKEWLYSYRENEAMGGYDPYSASKGAAEIAISSYRRSFESNPKSSNKIVPVRAGNVIGGGDWADDRIIPDCFRALKNKKAIPVRNKIATRPWQHVLEPLSGYLWLGAVLSNKELRKGYDDAQFLEGFNFGPELNSNRTVAELVEELLNNADGEWEDCSDPNALHEASKLNLAIDKAFHLLKWSPVWGFSQTVKQVADWYNYASKNSQGVSEFTLKQIKQYEYSAREASLCWSIEH